MARKVDEAQIFEIVAMQFAANGYDGVRTRKVAELAGVSEMTLFRRYRDKEGLISTALHERLTADDYAQLKYSGDLRADLIEAVRAWRVAHDRNGPIVFMLLAQAAGNPVLRKAATAILASNVSLGNLVTRYIREGKLPDIEPGHVISRLISPLVITDLVTHSTGRRPAEQLPPEQHVDYFLKGLAMETGG